MADKSQSTRLSKFLQRLEESQVGKVKSESQLTRLLRAISKGAANPYLSSIGYIGSSSPTNVDEESELEHRKGLAKYRQFLEEQGIDEIGLIEIAKREKEKLLSVLNPNELDRYVEIARQLRRKEKYPQTAYHATGGIRGSAEDIDEFKFVHADPSKDIGLHLTLNPELASFMTGETRGMRNTIMPLAMRRLKPARIPDMGQFHSIDRWLDHLVDDVEIDQIPSLPGFPVSQGYSKFLQRLKESDVGKAESPDELTVTVTRKGRKDRKLIPSSEAFAIMGLGEKSVEDMPKGMDRLYFHPHFVKQRRRLWADLVTAAINNRNTLRQKDEEPEKIDLDFEDYEIKKLLAEGFTPFEIQESIYYDRKQENFEKRQKWFTILKRIAHKHGFDSFTYPNEGERMERSDPDESIMLLYPNQVKSLTAAEKFDPSSPEITKEVGGSVMERNPYDYPSRAI